MNAVMRYRAAAGGARQTFSTALAALACLLVGHPAGEAPLVAIALSGQRILCCARCGNPLR